MPVDALFGRGRAKEFKFYLEEFAKTFGVPLTQPDFIPNTRRALAVTELARDRDLLKPFRDAVMAAHWVEGEDIESDAVLGRIAERVGLDAKEAVRAADASSFRDRIDEMRRDAHANGVTGIPTFFFGDIKAVGCRPYDDLARVAARAGFVRKPQRTVPQLNRR